MSHRDEDRPGKDKWGPKPSRRSLSGVKTWRPKVGEYDERTAYRRAKAQKRKGRK